MPPANFWVKEHVISCQHIRGYYRSLSGSQETELQLAVKQYVPRDNVEPQQGDVTIIAAHAVGFVKELYEPLWDELYLQLKSCAPHVKIRGIWIADVATHGQSAVLNEHKLGNDPSWNDHARDLLHLTNVFRKEMPQPIIGIGHSMGGTNIVQLALLHPRLLTSIICIEPIINKSHAGMNFSPSDWLTFRRDVWASREEAVAEARRSLPYKTWDERVLANWFVYGLRELPTSLYPITPKAISDRASENGGTLPVTLTTTKHHDVTAYCRGAFPSAGQPLNSFHPTPASHIDITKAEHDQMKAPLYRPEAVLTYQQLPFLRPSCLYLYGSESHRSFSSATAVGRADKLSVTGTAVGGNGGVAAQQVAEEVVAGGGHFLVLEKPQAIAPAACKWLKRCITEWRNLNESNRKAWDNVPQEKRAITSEDFKYWVKQAYGRKRTRISPSSSQRQAKL